MKKIFSFFILTIILHPAAGAEEFKPPKDAQPGLQIANAALQEKNAQEALEQKNTTLAKLFKKYPPSVQTVPEGDRVRITAEAHPNFPKKERGGARTVRLETGSGLFLDARTFSPQNPFGRAEFIVMPAGSAISQARIVVLGAGGGILWGQDFDLAAPSPAKSAPQGKSAKKRWPWRS